MTRRATFTPEQFLDRGSALQSGAASTTNKHWYEEREQPFFSFARIVGNHTILLFPL